MTDTAEVRAVGGMRMDDASDCRRLLSVANEALRRLGEPCFTREMAGHVRAILRWSDMAGAGTILEPDETPAVRSLRALADLIESILPPESQT